VKDRLQIIDGRTIEAKTEVEIGIVTKIVIENMVEIVTEEIENALAMIRIGDHLVAERKMMVLFQNCIASIRAR
jgi:hypothetical protein